MINNYNFNISEEEKRQILNLHESRTKRHYLINEQSDVINPTFEQAKQIVDKYNVSVVKNPNNPSFKDARYMNNIQIAMNKVNAGQNPVKSVQSQQTQTNNNYYSKYVKQAQTALGVPVDGKFGPDTLKALNALVVKVKPTAVPVTSGETSGATQTQVNKTNPENFTYDAKQALANFTAAPAPTPTPQKSVQNQQTPDASITKPDNDKLVGNQSIKTTGGLKY